MCTNLSLLFSGFAGVIIGVIITHFSQRKLVDVQITAANQAYEKLFARLGEQIDLQLRAAELSAVSTLLNSVNSQLGTSPSPSGDNLERMNKARMLYHQRLHEILGAMGRGVS